jgi:hypothetical protein
MWRSSLQLAQGGWGGDLRFEYEKADDARRGEILATLGGTSTALRSDWVAIGERGTEEGWYRVVFGSIKELDPVEGSEDRIRVLIETPEKTSRRGVCALPHRLYWPDCRHSPLAVHGRHAGHL